MQQFDLSNLHTKNSQIALREEYKLGSMSENHVYIQFTAEHPVIQKCQDESSRFAPLLCLNLLVSATCLPDAFSDFSGRFAHRWGKKKKKEKMLAVGTVKFGFAKARMSFSFGSSFYGEKHMPHLGLRLYTSPRKKPVHLDSKGLDEANFTISHHSITQL